MNKKPIIAIDVSSSRRGGPYVASMNIIDSKLKDEFEFKEIIYDNNLGRFISWKRIKNLKKQIDVIKPDGIIIAGLQLSCFHVCIAALLSGVKTRIITIHGSSTEAISISNIRKRILYLIEYLSLLMCTSFYGVSKYASTISASKYFNNKNRGHIYNLPTIEKSSDNISRETLGLLHDDIVIISTGRVIRAKGYAVLADTIRMIPDSNIKFIIVGDGNYLDEFKKVLSAEISQGRVICSGFTENVYPFLRISDIFVLPTLHETLSVSLLEASAVSLPLVSCNVGGVPEVIENSSNGFLVEPNNPEALKTALLKLSSNRELRVKMGHKALQRLHDVFSHDKSMDKLREIINNDLSNK